MLKGLAAAGAGVITGAANHGYVYQRRHLTVTRETIQVSGLSAALSGLRVGFLTDLHRSDTVPHEMATRPRSGAARGGPGPDRPRRRLRHDGERPLRYFVKPAAEALSPLHAKHGVFAVLGNHDDDQDMPAALTEAGSRCSGTRRTDRRSRRNARSGRGPFLDATRADIARVIRGASRNLILLAHNPARLRSSGA